MAPGWTLPDSPSFYSLDYQDSIDRIAKSEERKKEASKNQKSPHSNFMKKWSQEDENKLMEKLEGEDKINYNELEKELGRSKGGIRARCKQLIYYNYEEESWEQLIDIASIEKSNWERYLTLKKINADLKESKPEKEKPKTNIERIAVLENEVKELKKMITTFNYNKESKNPDLI